MTFESRYGDEPQTTQNLTLLDEFTTWLSMNRRKSTVEIRERYVRRIMFWAEAKQLQVTHLETRDLVSWLTSQVGPKPETKKSAKASLGIFFRWALIYGYVDADATKDLPTIRVPAALPRPCPELHLQRGLRRSTRACDVLMLLLAAYAGMRAAEIACLHTRDIYANKIRVSGKGGKERVVPLHPDIADFLWWFDDGLFFPSSLQVTGHVRPDSIGRRVRWLLSSPGWGCHTLRHRFATEVYQRHPDLLALRDLLGHSSVATTEIYARTHVDRLVQQVESLPTCKGLDDVRRGFQTSA